MIQHRKTCNIRPDFSGKHATTWRREKNAAFSSLMVHIHGVHFIKTLKNILVNIVSLKSNIFLTNMSHFISYKMM